MAIASWPKLLHTAIIIALFLLAYKAVLRGLTLISDKGRLDKTLVTTLRTICRWFVFIGIILALLQIWQVVDNVWTAVTGVLALVAIGFVAVWSVLSNALCSIFLMVERPIKVGDYIEFAEDGLGGIVTEIALLHTTMTIEDGGFVKIPNNLMYQKVIKRYPSGKPERPAEDGEESVSAGT